MFPIFVDPFCWKLIQKFLTSISTQNFPATTKERIVDIISQRFIKTVIKNRICLSSSSSSSSSLNNTSYELITSIFEER
ncbi:hypothetical protein DERP_000742 [Dermatophagoides pteronyssinus]|uniref:Uncharacterized protein n=1 Tax=Dermatophagoides pteronyssinus TaxID=6956 RepID=A0ABQ8J112_DERPT|nr:hypothetical protein DERP_000742 [Dermatophagoides pteronyssinus]